MNLKEWISNIEDKEDNFAYKFGAVAEAYDLWSNLTFLGSYKDGKCIVKGAFIQTYDEEKSLANFKLLHVFSKYRGQHMGKGLVHIAIETARDAGFKYWKCSSELDAWRFYERLGFQKQGQTKNYDSYLILGKIQPQGIELDYELDDYMKKLIEEKYPLI